MSKKLKISPVLYVVLLGGISWLSLVVTASNIESTAGAAITGNGLPNGGLEGMFVKYEGVDGEALDEGYNGWSEVLSFSQGMQLPAPGAAGPTRRRGDVVFDDLVLVKEIDKASPKIAEALCKGKVYPKVEIHVTASFVDPGRVTYFAYELKNVMVTSYNVSAGTHNLFRPVEEIGLNFEEIKLTYTEHDIRGQSKGNVEYSWKVEQGEP